MDLTSAGSPVLLRARPPPSHRCSWLNTAMPPEQPAHPLVSFHWKQSHYVKVHSKRSFPSVLTMSWEASCVPPVQPRTTPPSPHQGRRVHTSPCSLPGQPKILPLHAGPSISVTDHWVPHVSASPQDQPYAGTRNGGHGLCFAGCICCCSLQKPFHKH